MIRESRLSGFLTFWAPGAGLEVLKASEQTPGIDAAADRTPLESTSDAPRRDRTPARAECRGCG